MVLLVRNELVESIWILVCLLDHTFWSYLFFYSLSFQKDHLFQKSHYTLVQFSFKSIQDGPFWSCSQIGESVQKAPSSSYLNRSYIIFNNDQTWPSYTLSKEDPKIHKSHETAFELCWHQHFPTEFNTFCYIRK